MRRANSSSTGPSGLSAAFGIAWASGGKGVWSSQPLAFTSLSGKTRVVWPYPVQSGALQDASPDGRFLFQSRRSRREIVGRAPGASEERNLTWLNWSFPSDISADGKLVVFDEQQLAPHGIYLRPLDGSPAVRIGEGRSFGISPDGRWILTTRKLGAGELALLPTGAGEPRNLPKFDIALQTASWFPDGRRILISGSEPGHRDRLYVQDLPDGKPRAISPDGIGAAPYGAVSPDGKWVIAGGPGLKVAIFPVDGKELRPVPGVGADDLPLGWNVDSHSLYVLSSKEIPTRIDLLDVESGRRTPWKEFRPPDPAGVFNVGPARITPDGKAYVYSYRRLLDDLFLVTGLK